MSLSTPNPRDHLPGRVPCATWPRLQEEQTIGSRIFSEAEAEAVLASRAGRSSATVAVMMLWALQLQLWAIPSDYGWSSQSASLAEKLFRKPSVSQKISFMTELRDENIPRRRWLGRRGVRKTSVSAAQRDGPRKPERLRGQCGSERHGL